MIYGKVLKVTQDGNEDSDSFWFHCLQALTGLSVVTYDTGRKDLKFPT